MKLKIGKKNSEKLKFVLFFYIWITCYENKVLVWNFEVEKVY